MVSGHSDSLPSSTRPPIARAEQRVEVRHLALVSPPQTAYAREPGSQSLSYLICQLMAMQMNDMPHGFSHTVSKVHRERRIPATHNTSVYSCTGTLLLQTPLVHCKSTSSHMPMAPEPHAPPMPDPHMHHPGTTPMHQTPMHHIHAPHPHTHTCTYSWLTCCIGEEARLGLPRALPHRGRRHLLQHLHSEHYHASPRGEQAPGGGRPSYPLPAAVAADAPGLPLPRGREGAGRGLASSCGLAFDCALPPGRAIPPDGGLPPDSDVAPGDRVFPARDFLPRNGLPPGCDLLPRNGLPPGCDLLPSNGLPPGCDFASTAPPIAAAALATAQPATTDCAAASVAYRTARVADATAVAAAAEGVANAAAVAAAAHAFLCHADRLCSGAG